MLILVKLLCLYALLSTTHNLKFEFDLKHDGYSIKSYKLFILH
jgi:hypothetical protein